MSVTKLKAGLLSAAVVVAAGTPIVVQQQSVTRLRAENRELREQSQQLERFRSENQRLAGLQVDVEELNRLRKEVAELHRLRAEVALLRRESSDQRRPPSQSPAAPGPGRQSVPDTLLEYTPVGLWSDAGTSTPEASAETLLWALRTGDEHRLREMIQWQVTGTVDAPDVNLDAVERGAIDSMRQAVRGMQGGRISSTEPIGKTGMKIRFEATHTDGKAVSHEIIFARQDTGWKVAVSFLKENNPTGGSQIRMILPFVPEPVASTQ